MNFLTTNMCRMCQDNAMQNAHVSAKNIKSASVSVRDSLSARGATEYNSNIT